MNKFNAPRSQSDYNPERRGKLLAWFDEHQGHYPDNAIPRAQDMDNAVTRIKELYRLSQNNDSGFQAIQERCGQLTMAWKILNAMKGTATDIHSAEEAFDRLLAGKTLNAYSLRAFYNWLTIDLAAIGEQNLLLLIQWFIAGKIQKNIEEGDT